MPQRCLVEEREERCGMIFRKGWMFDHHIFTDFVYLLVAIDPVSLVPEFMGVTRHQSPETRRMTAMRGTVIAAGILIAFIVVGQILLEALGISLPSFSIAGGLVLLAISLQQVLTTEGIHVDEEIVKSRHEGRDVAVFPLATPYIAGPASILAVVLLTDNRRFGFVEQAQTTVVMLFILVITCVVLIASEPVQRLLGQTGLDVVSRIFGLILAALAVETILEGIRATFSLS